MRKTCVYPRGGTQMHARRIRTGDLRLLRLSAQECGYVEIVAGYFALDFAYVLLNLMDHGFLFLKGRKVSDRNPKKNLRQLLPPLRAILCRLSTFLAKILDAWR